MKPYEELALLPNLIAETVCATEYTGREVNGLGAAFVQKIEQARQQMTPEQVKEFAGLCDRRCFLAYEKRANWFLRCVRSKSNRGRDQLYVWITHWLASYLDNPAGFRQSWEQGLNSPGQEVRTIAAHRQLCLSQQHNERNARCPDEMLPKQ